MSSNNFDAFLPPPPQKKKKSVAPQTRRTIFTYISQTMHNNTRIACTVDKAGRESIELEKKPTENYQRIVLMHFLAPFPQRYAQ
jgi:hypothetical protein